MSTPDHKSDAKANDVIAAYLRAVDAGQQPDRDELLARHPEVNAELRTFFADLDGVKALAAPLRQVIQCSPAQVGQARAAANGDSGHHEGQTETAADQDVFASMMRPAVAEATPPKIREIGEYDLLEEIGRGGMGIVYKARQRGAERLVALKMILAGQLASPQDVFRFEQEARRLAQLDHPNIVPLFGVGTEGDRHYFSMKLIDGGSLAQIWPLVGRYRDIAQLLVKVARAVHYAHQHGILHRDLKPANILLDASGSPHVADFGLAKALSGDGCNTSTGAILGTASYMAPEQAEGKKALTTAADVYSLGAILYELLTRRPPFRGDTVLQTLRQVIEEEPSRPRQIRPKIPKDLEVICLKCLQKQPGNRFASAEALADDLERWLEHRPIRSRRTNLFERIARLGHRKPFAVGVFAGILVTLVVGAVVWAYVVPPIKSFITQPSADQMYLYSEDMKLAQRARDEGDGQELRRLLDKHQPTSFFDWRDPRDAQWYKFDAEARRFLGRIPVANVKPGAVAWKWSPDSQRLAILYLDERDLNVTPPRKGWVQVLAVWDAATRPQLSESEYLSNFCYLGAWDSTRKTIEAQTRPPKPDSSDTSRRWSSSGRCELVGHVFPWNSPFEPPNKVMVKVRVDGVEKEWLAQIDDPTFYPEGGGWLGGCGWLADTEKIVVQ
jgi:serine/threonine protein kinase